MLSKRMPKESNKEHELVSARVHGPCGAFVGLVRNGHMNDFGTEARHLLRFCLIMNWKRFSSISTLTS